MEDAVDLIGFGDDGVAGGARPSARDDGSPRPRAGALSGLASRVVRLGQLYFGQAGLILRGRATQGRPCCAFATPAGAELLYLPAGRGGARAAALFGPALSPEGAPLPDAARRPTLLFFYGNGMYLAESLAIFQHLRRLGANVLVPEYLGYGLSEGSSGEAECYATADAAWRHLRSRADIDPSLIVAAGVSLGGAVAVDLAAREPGVAGLVALVTFTSIPDMARHLHPDVPIWRLIRLKFDSLRKMPRVTCPALIGHSTADALVPPWMADRLAAAAAGPVTRLVIDGANHHAAELLEVGGDVIFGAVERFLHHLATSRRNPSELRAPSPP